MSSGSGALIVPCVRLRGYERSNCVCEKYIQRQSYLGIAIVSSTMALVLYLFFS